jgi:alpha/beta superfamily hydrolase
VDVAQHLAEFWRTSHSPGERDFWLDLQGAVDFIRQSVPGLPLALVGYSFGCTLLPCVGPSADLAALALVAPTVDKHDYDLFLAVNSPLLVVASEDDFAADAQRLERWFDALSMPRQLLRPRRDNHFFRGHEDWLVETVYRFLDEQGR